MSKPKAPTKRILTLNGLQQILKGREKLQGINSVPSPSAQSAKPCGLVSVQDQILRQVEASLATLKISNPPCYLIARLLFESGSRISEILAIRSTDITPAGRIMIKAKKGSRDRIISAGHLGDDLLKLRKRQGLIFGDISRFHVYRSFRSVGLSHIFDGRSKASVTHIFRHLAAMDLEQTEHGKQAITTGLGHRSERSADHYSAEKLNEVDQDEVNSSGNYRNHQ